MIHLADVPDAPLADTEVRIATKAVGLNFLDLMRCRGGYPLPPEFPLTFGVEVAGHVVETGGATGFAVGVDVIACPTLPRSALGDRVVVDAAYVVDRPAHVDATDGNGVDVAVEQVGGHVFAQSLDALAFEGTIVAVGAAGGPRGPSTRCSSPPAMSQCSASAIAAPSATSSSRSTGDRRERTASRDRRLPRIARRGAPERRDGMRRLDST